jgi:hypothetical protein
MSPTNITSAITVEPTTPSTAFTDFILAQLNWAALRSKIITNQIETAITALRAGLITPEMALLVLTECGLEISSF